MEPTTKPDIWATAPVVDLGAEAAKLGAKPPQDYGATPPPAEAPKPAPAPGTGAEGDAAAAEPKPGTVVPRKQTAEKAAKMTVDLIDHLQSNVFSLFADEESNDKFKFDEGLRGDLSDYLGTGIEESGSKFRMPWYVPFSFVLLISLFANFRTMRRIRKEKREAEEAKAVEEQAAEVVRQPMRMRTEPIITPPPAAPASPAPAAISAAQGPELTKEQADAVRALQETSRQGVEVVRSTKALAKCQFPTCGFHVKKEGDKYCGQAHYRAHTKMKAEKRKADAAAGK